MLASSQRSAQSKQCDDGEHAVGLWAQSVVGLTLKPAESVAQQNIHRGKKIQGTENRASSNDSWFFLPLRRKLGIRDH